MEKEASLVENGPQDLPTVDAKNPERVRITTYKRATVNGKQTTVPTTREADVWPGGFCEAEGATGANAAGNVYRCVNGHWTVTAPKTVAPAKVNSSSRVPAATTPSTPAVQATGTPQTPQQTASPTQEPVATSEPPVAATPPPVDEPSAKPSPSKPDLHDDPTPVETTPPPPATPASIPEAGNAT